MNWQEYLEMIREGAKEVCETYELPYACCVAQGALESQWGKYGLGNGRFNIFGRKAVDGDDYVEVETGEDDGTGNLYYIMDKFKSYPTIKEAIKDWCELMWWVKDNGEDGPYVQYARQYQSDRDLEAFVRGISGVYATDIYYADKVLGIINDPDCELL